MRIEDIEEAVLRDLAFGRGRSGREVHRNHRDVGEVGFDVPPLGIELGIAETELDPPRPALCIQSRAAVPPFLSAVKKTVQAGLGTQGIRDVDLVRLDLLQADDVGIGSFDPPEHALGRG